MNVCVYEGIITTHSGTPEVISNKLGEHRIKLKIKSVTFSSQGSNTGQLDFCN